MLLFLQLKDLCGIAHELVTAAEAIVTQMELESINARPTDTAFYLKCIDRALRSGVAQLHKDFDKYNAAVSETKAPRKRPAPDNRATVEPGEYKALELLKQNHYGSAYRHIADYAYFHRLDNKCIFFFCCVLRNYFIVRFDFSNDIRRSIIEAQLTYGHARLEDCANYINKPAELYEYWTCLSDSAFQYMSAERLALYGDISVHTEVITEMH